jgi:diguanylate cyclase (GGDEF)-like protein
MAETALRDTLTGLPDRAAFMDRLTRLLADPHHAGVAVIFLDVDSFKAVNDGRGRAAADALLVAVCGRMARCLRPPDVLARFGGDEFMVLACWEDDADEAVSVAERIVSSMHAPFTIDGRELRVTVSAGVALAGNGLARRPEDLIREADMALYQAKAAGRSRCVVFDGGARAAPPPRLTLHDDLRRAIERDELCLYFQPEVDLVSGAIVGMEALVRWQHPRRGLIPPSEFIGIAEGTGLIVRLGRWVLEQACRQARAWQHLCPNGRPLVMSVNLSVRQFEQPGLVAEVARILRETELEPSRLRLEITEGIVIEDAEASVATLHALKRLGVGLAIDDFGTGYSSLSYLRRLPVDTLKIDRSFVRDLDREPGARAIVETITTLAHTLGMDVTAEGIETAAELASVRPARCDRGQGFFFSRPVPAETLTALLTREPPCSPAA